MGIELEESKATLLKDKVVQEKIRERGEEAAEELVKTKKVFDDLEREEQILKQVFQKLLESAVRLRMKCSKLAKERGALGVDQ